MLPVVLTPAVVQTPQAVDMSPFTGLASDAALGRLPVHVVPQPVQGARVANDQRGGQQRQEQQPSSTPVTNNTSTGFSILSQAGKQDIRLPAPFSTTFLAQLFGQIPMEGPEQADVAAIWLGNGETSLDYGYVDFERLEEYGQVKYAPSGAKLHAGDNLSVYEEIRTLAPQTYRRSLRGEGAVSVFANGLTAYASTQGRNLSLAASRAQEYSAIF